jgi:phenylalanyl-tRNA synthetase alpha chain
MSLTDQIKNIEGEVRERIGKADSLVVLKDLRVLYLGRKSPVMALLKTLGSLPPDERKAAGAQANSLKQLIETELDRRTTELDAGPDADAIDPTLPGTGQRLGSVHVVNQVMGEICHTFYGMGFEIAHGPHIETDHYNFTALNFAPDHPARDMQDTFFVEGDRLLRTHTTSVQARELENRKPPIKIITPGKTFRNEVITTRAHVSFHQVDGFMVDEGVSFADLKGALVAFCQAFFGRKLKLKFRPSYFPFTEPSAEVDISCFLCEGKGCQLCKHSGWLEILGCGMIHPNVLEAAGWDSERYTGYAFGMGVERVAMLKYKITDIRLLFNNNVRFLRQFV